MIKAKSVGKVSDFELQFGNGIINCCWDDIQERSEENAFIGMIIECEHCGQAMVLNHCPDNKLRWQAHKG